MLLLLLLLPLCSYNTFARVTLVILVTLVTLVQGDAGELPLVGESNDAGWENVVWTKGDLWGWLNF